MRETKQVQLTPENAAVIGALQRLVAAMSLEADMLVKIWKQDGAAHTIKAAIVDLDRYGQKFIESSQRRIVIPEMPAGL